MLKTVSSITNAIGALNFVGTWNASANLPPIASGVGVKGDYYVVGTAGSTTIDGISNWGIGDWIVYNGSVWQRVEGGANLNGVDISFTGTSSGPTYETSNATTGLTIADNEIEADGTDTNINIVITPKGSGNAVLTTGNLVVADGNGIDFSATPGTGTSELLDDYEEGTWTPTITSQTGTFTTITYDALRSGRYQKIGNTVYIQGIMRTDAITVGTASGQVRISSLPFTSASTLSGSVLIGAAFAFGGDMPSSGLFLASSTDLDLYYRTSVNGASLSLDVADLGTGANANYAFFAGFYTVA